VADKKNGTLPATEKVNLKSKRFIILVALDLLWAGLLIFNSPVGLALAPWLAGINGVWILGESYRPSGVVEGVVRNILGTDEE